MRNWKLKLTTLVFCAFCVTAQADQPPGRVYEALGTSTALDNGGVFTSPWVDVQAYNSVVNVNFWGTELQDL